MTAGSDLPAVTEVDNTSLSELFMPTNHNFLASTPEMGPPPMPSNDYLCVDQATLPPQCVDNDVENNVMYFYVPAGPEMQVADQPGPILVTHCEGANSMSESFFLTTADAPPHAIVDGLPSAGNHIVAEFSQQQLPQEFENATIEELNCSPGLQSSQTVLEYHWVL